MADRVADDFPHGYMRYQTGDMPIERDRAVTGEQRTYHGLLRHDAALAWSREVGRHPALPHLLDYAEVPGTAAGWAALREAVGRRAAGLFTKSRSHGQSAYQGRQKGWIVERVAGRMAEGGAGQRYRFDALVRETFDERPRNMPR